MASLLFFEWLEANPKSDPWKQRNKLPLLKDWATELKVTSIAYPARPPEVLPSTSKLDERRLNQLIMSMLKRQAGPAMEADVFLLLAAIRGEHRTYFPWAALACDAQSGFLFPPVMGSPADKREDLLIQCLLQALEVSPFRPKDFRVSDEFARAALEPLGQSLDIPVKIAPLKAMAEARQALEAQVRF